MIDFLWDNWALTVTIFLSGLGYILIDQYQSTYKKFMCSPEEAVEKINRQKAQVIDIRPQAAYRAGHIVNAKSLPENTLSSWLLENQDMPVVIVCQDGREALSQSYTLTAQRSGPLWVLSGGMNAWQQSSLPVVKK